MRPRAQFIWFGAIDVTISFTHRNKLIDIIAWTYLGWGEAFDESASMYAFFDFEFFILYYLIVNKMISSKLRLFLQQVD